MDKHDHIRLLGWLYIAYGALILVGAAFGLLTSLVSGIVSFDIGQLIMGSIVGVFVAALLVVLSLPSLYTGKGLLDGKSWARVIAMVLAVISVFNFPLGTALCVYTFWVLWGKDADPYFEGSYPRYHERY